MEILPILIPPITSYIVSTYCPFTPNFDSSTREETKADNIVREKVLPIISGVIGFAWYFSRNKAQILKNTVKSTTKGTRNTVNFLSKLFQGSHKYIIDLVFILLIGSLNYWIYQKDCQKDTQKALYALFVTIAVTIFVIYLTASYSVYSPLFLIPLLVWLLFTAEFKAREFYFTATVTPNVDDVEDGNVKVEVDVDVQMEESPKNDAEKANIDLKNLPKDVKEQFRIW